jgi:U8 snoRNA-decapping enzyme
MSFEPILERDRRGKIQAVFAAIYCPNAKPWEAYADKVYASKENVPLVLMQLRWDGKIGFPGGKVDEGETKIQALVRELEEEIDLDISYFAGTRLEHLVSYYNADEDIDIHCYSFEVTEKEMSRILLCAQQTTSHKAEVGGVFAIQIADYGDKGGFKEFRKNNFKASAGLELDMLIKREGWL